MSKKIIYGLFDDEEVLLKSAKQMVKSGVYIRDVFSPFPIHGIDPVIGIPRTNLHKAGFIYGAIGLATAWAMIWGLLIIDWPMNIGGKPNFTFWENLPAFIPISFELTVFCSAHGMVITYLIVNKLFPGQEPHNPDPRTTDDKFMMQINLEDTSVSEGEIKSMLESGGAIEITEKEV